jgi:hypothetical protein
MLLGRVRTAGDGRPLLPSRALWAHVFGEPLPQDERDKPAVADAAWLAAVVLTKDLQVRSDRLDQYAFGQRVFGSADERDADSAEAIRAFPRTRMLMLSLERIGVTASDTYAAAARNAARLSSMEGRRGFMAVAQFQGALALVVRMARVQSLDAEDAGWLVDDLVAREPNRDDQYGSAIADWLTQSLLPMLPHARNAEMAVLLGLAGRTEIAPTPVAWEGQQYRLDLSASELRRLRHIRERQGGYSLDEAVELDRIRRVVEDPTSSGDHIREAIEKIRLLAEDLEPAGKTDPGTLAPGVDPPRSARRLVDRILKDLSKPDAVNDRSRVKEAAEAVSELTDAVLAQALLSITYAIDLGDADGSVLLVGDVAIRHDFGFGMRDATVRARVQWGVPKVDVVPGQPWRVKGSLLGLDVGLSSLALRRITADLVSGAPTLTSNERESFAVSLALLNPYGLRDVDRDGIAAAVRRGRARILALDASGLDDVIDGIRMDGWRARAVRWMFAHRTGRDEILSLFSLSELLYLSSDSTPGEDDWGMSAIATVGCVCTRLKPTGRWTMWTGRPQAGVMSALVADLNLHVVEILNDLQLPAQLARHVLAAAVQDFIDEVRPTDPNDWLTLVRSAQRVSRERVEDYVAAAAAVDGPLVPETNDNTTRRVP